MFPLGGATEAPKDQVVIWVVSGVPYGHVPEETALDSYIYVYKPFG